MAQVLRFSHIGLMKVTFCTREYSNLSGGQNTWLCHFLPDLRRLGIESRVLFFTSSHEEELPTVRSLRQAGVKCTTSSDEEKRYTEQRVRWLLEQLAENPPDVFVAKKPNGRLRLAYVGRLAEEAKRISEVTRALCRAVREVPGTEAFIYGDGEDRSAVEHILREEGEGLPVHLAGRVENDQISKHLLKCHAVVLLSDWEGLGLSLLEGMACGLVPIGLRHARGGAPELIEHGVTGLLVDDRGDGFVAAVRRLREDQSLWERLARSARARVEAEYSIEICAARWQELLRELVNGCASRKPLRIPRRLDLPPVHPALAWLDHRLPRPHQELIRRARSFVSRMKYQYPNL